MPQHSLVFMGSAWSRLLGLQGRACARLALDDQLNLWQRRLSGDSTEEVITQTLQWLEHELAKGRWVGGFLSYEFGAAMEQISCVSATASQTPDAHLVSFEPGALEIAQLEPARGCPTSQVAIPASLACQQQHFEQSVRQVGDLIADGRLYQLNLTVAFEVPAAAALRTERLDQILASVMAPQPVPYGMAVDWGQGRLIGLSMERCLRLSGDRVAKSRPIKGTSPRGRSAQDDARAAEALRGSEKERAENTMIVDMVRNDLARVSRPGGVTVTTLLEPVAYSTLWHLESEVEAELATHVTQRDLMRALLPPASVTGCPKVSAMQAIARMEGRRRGAYCGVQGLWTPDHGAELAVAIRQMEIAHGRARISVGSGIVADSRPNDEWNETCLKAQSALRGLAGLQQHRLEAVDGGR